MMRKTKRTSGGRVEISLLKNDLETLASTSAAPAPASQDQPRTEIVDLGRRTERPEALPESLPRKQEAFYLISDC